MCCFIYNRLKASLIPLPSRNSPRHYVYVHLGAFFKFFEFFFPVIFPLSISVIFLSSPYFTPKLFYFSLAFYCCSGFVHSPPTCWLKFLSLFWNFLFGLYCLTLSLFLLRTHSFAKIFWFISSNCILRHFGVFPFHWIPVCFNFLSSFACCHSFFICPSILIYHPGFGFLFRFLRSISILLLTIPFPVQSGSSSVQNGNSSLQNRNS